MPTPRTLRTLALASLLATFPSCGRGARDGGGADLPEAGADTGRRLPGVVLFVFDTLRADGLTAYGGGGRMPALDAFAAESTVFVDASSNATWTAPSVASVLTGLEPSHHGVYGPGSAPPLPPSVTTLAEVLKAAGWTTAAFTAGGWVAPEHGVDQGFDAFGTALDVSGPEALLASWDRRRPKDRPFFLLIHTYAAHDPYGRKVRTAGDRAGAVRDLVAAADGFLEEAERHGGRLPPEAPRLLAEAYLTDAPARFALLDLLAARKWEDRFWDQCAAWLDGPYAGEPGGPELATRLRAAYEDGLEFADEVFSRAMRALDGFRLPQGTAYVTLSDHGEGFGEHVALSHGRRLYDELTRVPLLVRAPGRLPPGAVRGSCALVDVFPTVLDLAGLPVPPGIDGRSLVPLGSGRAAGRPVVAEERRKKADRPTEAPLEVTSVRNQRGKFIHTFDPVTRESHDELYDLVDDPAELHPLPLSDSRRFGADFCALVRLVRDRPRREVAAGTTPDASLCEGLLR